MALVAQAPTPQAERAAAQWRFIQRRRAEREMKRILSTSVGRALVKSGKVMLATRPDGAVHVAYEGV